MFAPQRTSKFLAKCGGWRTAQWKSTFPCNLMPCNTSPCCCLTHDHLSHTYSCTLITLATSNCLNILLCQALPHYRLAQNHLASRFYEVFLCQELPHYRLTPQHKCTVLRIIVSVHVCFETGPIVFFSVGPVLGPLISLLNIS